jgi:sugar phosphate isomerase/epimerase
VLPVWLTDTLTPDLSRAIHYTLLWGLEGVVLRTLEGGARVPDVNESRLRRRLAQDDLPVVAIDPGLFEGEVADRAVWLNDLARIHEAAAFCNRIGCPMVLMGSLPGDSADAVAEPLRRAADRASHGNVRLAIRNEGTRRTTAAELAAVLDAVGHGGVVGCWDAAASMAAGEPAVEGARSLSGRLGLVVVRDGEMTSDGWQRSPLGEGGVGWNAVLKELRASGFDGPLCLDASGFTAKEGLREATALIRLMRRAATG